MAAIRWIICFFGCKVVVFFGRAPSHVFLEKSTIYTLGVEVSDYTLGIPDFKIAE